MRKLNYVLCVLAVLLLTIAGCTKEAGPQGPAGTNGINGQDGNADVKMFLFTSNDTITVSKPLVQHALPGLTADYLDSSLVLVYYKDIANVGLYYAAPGLGYNNVYQTKWFTTGNAVIDLRVADPDGSAFSGAPRIFNPVKVIVAKASSFGKKDPVDYTDYKATMRYFGLKE